MTTKKPITKVVTKPKVKRAKIALGTKAQEAMIVAGGAKRLRNGVVKVSDTRQNSKHRKGRPLGSGNKKIDKLIEVIETGGLTPLEYMLVEMRNTKNDKQTRLQAARDAAPYLHPRLSSIVHKGDPKSPLVSRDLTTQEFEDAARKLLTSV